MAPESLGEMSAGEDEKNGVEDQSELKSDETILELSWTATENLAVLVPSGGAFLKFWKSNSMLEIKVGFYSTLEFWSISNF